MISALNHLDEVSSNKINLEGKYLFLIFVGSANKEQVQPRFKSRNIFADKFVFSHFCSTSR